MAEIGRRRSHSISDANRRTSSDNALSNIAALASQTAPRARSLSRSAPNYCDSHRQHYRGDVGLLCHTCPEKHKRTLCQPCATKLNVAARRWCCSKCSAPDDDVSNRPTTYQKKEQLNKSYWDDALNGSLPPRRRARHDEPNEQAMADLDAAAAAVAGDVAADAAAVTSPLNIGSASNATSAPVAPTATHAIPFRSHYPVPINENAQAISANAYTSGRVSAVNNTTHGADRLINKIIDIVNGEYTIRKHDVVLPMSDSLQRISQTLDEYDAMHDPPEYDSSLTADVLQAERVALVGNPFRNVLRLSDAVKRMAGQKRAINDDVEDEGDDDDGAGEFADNVVDERLQRITLVLEHWRAVLRGVMYNLPAHVATARLTMPRKDSPTKKEHAEPLFALLIRIGAMLRAANQQYSLLAMAAAIALKQAHVPMQAIELIRAISSLTCTPEWARNVIDGGSRAYVVQLRALVDARQPFKTGLDNCNPAARIDGNRKLVHNTTVSAFVPTTDIVYARAAAVQASLTSLHDLRVADFLPVNVADLPRTKAIVASYAASMFGLQIESPFFQQVPAPLKCDAFSGRAWPLNQAQVADAVKTLVLVDKCVPQNVPTVRVFGDYGNTKMVRVARNTLGIAGRRLRGETGLFHYLWAVLRAIIDRYADIVMPFVEAIRIRRSLVLAAKNYRQAVRTLTLLLNAIIRHSAAKLAGGAITVESISKYVADLYSVGRDKALLAAGDVDGVRIRALTRDLLVAMQLDHAVSANKPGLLLDMLSASLVIVAGARKWNYFDEAYETIKDVLTLPINEALAVLSNMVVDTRHFDTQTQCHGLDIICEEVVKEIKATASGQSIAYDIEKSAGAMFAVRRVAQLFADNAKVATSGGKHTTSPQNERARTLVARAHTHVLDNDITTCQRQQPTSHSAELLASKAAKRMGGTNPSEHALREATVLVEARLNRDCGRRDASRPPLQRPARADDDEHTADDENNDDDDDAQKEEEESDADVDDTVLPSASADDDDEAAPAAPTAADADIDLDDDSITIDDLRNYFK